MATDRSPDTIWSELEAAGMYDPRSADAERRRHALQLLIDRGASVDAIVANRDDLGAFSTRLALAGSANLTQREIAERAGLTIEALERLSLAIGIPDPGPDALIGNERDLALFQLLTLAEGLFGEEATRQLARVVGAAAGKIADAVVSAFAANIAPALAEDTSGLELIQTNLDLADLLPTFMSGFEQLFRRHAIIAARPLSASSLSGYEAQRLSVGFVDIVGSTALAGRISTAELGRALSAFEGTSADIVVSHRGRVVKLIGDGLMFTVGEAGAACRIAGEIVAAFADHALLPPVRAGLAYGDVLSRDGDCFGPVVNLAARIASQAGPGEIIVEAGMVAELGAADWSLTPIGSTALKGFAEAVPLARLHGG